MPAGIVEKKQKSGLAAIVPYVDYTQDCAEYIRHHGIQLEHLLSLPCRLQILHDIVRQHSVTMVFSVSPDSLRAIKTFAVGIHKACRTVGKSM